MANQLLTHSRQQAFKSCRKRHWFAYELALRPIVDAKALRMGSAWHAGLDEWKTSGSADHAIEHVEWYYSQAMLGDNDTEAVALEMATVKALLVGYIWRWQASPLEVIASEQAFRLPLVNPETGGRSTVFDVAGKIDGVVKLEDRRKAVEEHKLISDDIAVGSDYWQRLQIDHQITLYVYAARQLGHDVATVLYDVARKPTIRPNPVAVVDDLGAKIVLDANGNRVKTEKGLWRQTGSEKDGYTLQTRPMTPDEWSKRLIDDIGERPDFYFSRVEIPRLDSEIDECLAELWDIQQTIRDAQNKCRWYRTVGKDTCSWCPYFGLCASKWTPEAALPEGFQFVSNVNPELGGSANGDANDKADAPADF